ncbi:MAG: T9SS type A sorting domain-containing protein [Candidatus Cloacimonetes bacterium]|nr:T9SS type A sorting domain-containing protein [Candidatus Cloacimonadota bacterium]
MKKLFLITLILALLTSIFAVDRLPNVMVTGYWEPTGSMVAQFSIDPGLNPGGWNGANWNNLGYNIYSFFPPPEVRDFEVDYQDTWEDFWAVADTLHPIAIISFGAGNGPWEIETMSTNNSYWVPDDVAPYQPTPSPPDDTVPAGFNRYGTLPFEAIADAVNNQTNINAWVDWNGDMGNYLCEFMAYLVLWYKDLHSAIDDPYPCYASGFTHVNSGIPLAQCVEAAEITIETVLININLTVNGTVNYAGGDVTGTTIMLEGNTSMTTTIEDNSGVFTFTGLTSGNYTVTAYRNRMLFTTQEVYIDGNNTDIQLNLMDIIYPNEFSVCSEPAAVHTLNTANPCNVALRIRPEDLPEMQMKIFTDISFYPPVTTDSCDVAVFIYEYHNGLMVPGNLIYEAPVEITQADTWNTHYLEYPILIDENEEYFIGYRVTNNQTNQIAWKDSGPQVFANGTWACFGTQWMNMSYLHANWMLKAGYMTPQPVAVSEETLPVTQLHLSNYPNPFNPTTNILFSVVNSDMPVSLKVYDVKGRLVNTLLQEKRAIGEYNVPFNGCDESRKPLASGIYFISLINGDNRQTHKIVLMK